MTRNYSGAYNYEQVTQKKKLAQGRPLTYQVPFHFKDPSYDGCYARLYQAICHFSRTSGICSASSASLATEANMSERTLSRTINVLIKRGDVFAKTFRSWGECKTYYVASIRSPMAIKELQRIDALDDAQEIMEFFEASKVASKPEKTLVDCTFSHKRKAVVSEGKQGVSPSRKEADSPFVFPPNDGDTLYIDKLSMRAKENSIRAHAREEAAAEPPAEDAAAFFNSEMERDLAKRLKPEEVKKAMEIHARLSVEELAKPKNMIGWLIVAVQQGWGDKYLERKSPEEVKENIQANEKTAKAMEYAVWSTRDERKNYSTMASAGNKTLEICSGGASCQTDFIEYSLPTSEFNLKLIEAAKKRRLLQCPAIASIVNQLPGSDPDATESVSMTPSQRSKDPFKKNSSLSYQPRPSNSSDPSESRSSSRCQYPHHTRNLSKAIFSEERMSKSQTSQTSLSLSKMLSTDSFGKTIHRLSPSMQEKYTGKKRELSYG